MYVFFVFVYTVTYFFITDTFSPPLFMIIFDIFTFSTIRSIKYCIGPKNRLRDFDGSPRFEGYCEQKEVIFGMSSVCVCVCLSLSVCLSVYTIAKKK